MLTPCLLLIQQISLAHFCELHGPTSILCTQLNPVSCPTCFPCPTLPPPPAEDLTRNSSISSLFWESPGTPVYHTTAPLLYSPFDSPPTSPHSSNSSYNPYFGEYLPSASSRSSFGRPSFSSDYDFESCDSCSYLVPQGVSDRLPDGAPGSPTKDGKGRHGTPVLRTTQPITAYGPAEYEDEEDEEEEEEQHPDHDHDHDHEDETTDTYFHERNSLDMADPLSHASSSPDSVVNSARSSASSFLPQTHTHTLTYVTTRQPTSPVSYSLLRRSCIRTLSCETLPRSAPNGPLYFGDPVAGYTIAYVFRLKDPSARGRRRTYALIAMGGRDSWRVSTAYVAVTRFFERIAQEIVAMADRVLEKEAASRPSASSGIETPPLSTSLPMPSSAESSTSPEKTKDGRTTKSAATSPTSATRSTRNAEQMSSRLSDVSSFLSAKRVDTEGFPRVSRDVTQAKALSEIVGNERIFVELHQRFVLLLGRLAGTAS
jgi:hypothetical protein